MVSIGRFDCIYFSLWQCQYGLGQCLSCFWQYLCCHWQCLHGPLIVQINILHACTCIPNHSLIFFVNPFFSFLKKNPVGIIHVVHVKNKSVFQKCVIFTTVSIRYLLYISENQHYLLNIIAGHHVLLRHNRQSGIPCVMNVDSTCMRNLVNFMTIPNCTLFKSC